MIRRGLLGVAILLLVGALADATLHNDAVGRRIIGQADASPATSLTVERARDVPLLTTSMGGDPVVGTYSLYLQLRGLTPGATLLIDSMMDGLPRELLLRTVSATADVRMVELPDSVAGQLSLLDGPTLDGTYRQGPWEIYLETGPVATLVVTRRDGPTKVVDARLLDVVLDEAAAQPVDAAQVTSARGSDRRPTLTHAIVAESLVLLLLMVAGGALLPRTGMGRPVRVLLAPIVGVALHAALALLLLPGLLGLAATLSVALLLAGFARARGEDVGWRADDLRALAAVSTFIVVIVVVARWSQFVSLTGDSRTYWAGGAAFADGTLGPDLISLSRGLAQQALHAVGFSLGAEGLQAIGAVLLGLSLLIILAIATTQDGGGRVSLWSGTVLGAVAIGLALLASPQVRTLAAYINAHILVAALLLTLVILVGAATLDDPRGTSGRSAQAAIAATVTALVLARPEGPLLAALVLVATFAIPAEPDTEDGSARTGRGASRFRPAWAALGAATLLWAALLVRSSFAAGARPAPALVLLGSAGLLMLLVAGALPRVPEPLLRSTPTVVLVMLWAITLVLLGRERVNFVEMAIANLGQGFGGWGVLGPLMIVAALLAVVLSGLTASTSLGWIEPARVFLIGFIPLLVISRLSGSLGAEGAALESLLRGGGRVGWGDSVNRMWSHGILVAALLLIGAGRTERSVQWAPSGPGRILRVGPAVLVVALFGSWVAVQWEPHYLPARSTIEATRVLAIEGQQPIAELLDGVRVDQTVVLNPPALPPGSRATGVCVDVGLVTLDRRTTGTVTIAVSAEHLQSSRSIDARRVSDWSGEEVCLTIDDGGSPDASIAALSEMLQGLRISVSGAGAEPEAAVSALQGSGGILGAVVTIASADGSLLERRVGPLVHSVDVRYRRAVPWFYPVADDAVARLPWALVLVATATVVAAGIRASPSGLRRRNRN